MPSTSLRCCSHLCYFTIPTSLVEEQTREEGGRTGQRRKEGGRRRANAYPGNAEQRDIPPSLQTAGRQLAGTFSPTSSGVALSLPYPTYPPAYMDAGRVPYLPTTYR